MGYFDKLNNESLNKYKQKLKKIIDILFYLWIDGHLNFM
jgi:hypothetical protein